MKYKKTKIVITVLLMIFLALFIFVLIKLKKYSVSSIKSYLDEVYDTEFVLLDEDCSFDDKVLYNTSFDLKYYLSEFPNENMKDCTIAKFKDDNNIVFYVLYKKRSLLYCIKNIFKSEENIVYDDYELSQIMYDDEFRSLLSKNEYFNKTPNDEKYCNGFINASQLGGVVFTVSNYDELEEAIRSCSKFCINKKIRRYNSKKINSTMKKTNMCIEQLDCNIYFCNKGMILPCKIELKNIFSGEETLDKDSIEKEIFYCQKKLIGYRVDLGIPYDKLKAYNEHYAASYEKIYPLKGKNDEELNVFFTYERNRFCCTDSYVADTYILRKNRETIPYYKLKLESPYFERIAKYFGYKKVENDDYNILSFEKGNDKIVFKRIIGSYEIDDYMMDEKNLVECFNNRSSFEFATELSSVLEKRNKKTKPNLSRNKISYATVLDSIIKDGKEVKYEYNLNLTEIPYESLFYDGTKISYNYIFKLEELQKIFDFKVEYIDNYIIKIK